MKIDGFGEFLPNSIGTNKNKANAAGMNNTFSDLLKSVNQDQVNEQKAIDGFISGEGIELHEVMIAGEKAKTSLALLNEIKNRTLDMFNQLTKTPV